MVFPKQKILTSSKNRQWRIDCVNFIINDSSQERYADVIRMTEAYRLVNSQLDQEEYRDICQNLGVSVESGRKYVEAYNKAHNVYSTLKGEELNRPFNFSVVNIAQEAINEVTLHEEAEYRKYISSIVEKESKLIAKEMEVERKMKEGTLSPERMEREMKIFNQELEDRYAEILDINRLKARVKSKATVKERTVQKLLKIAINNQNIAWVKNETFGDAIIAGKEMVEIRFERKGELPKIRQLNVLNTYSHKSPDTPFTHNADYAGYIEHCTVGQVLDMWGDRMNPKDVDRLTMFTYDGNGQYGVSDTMFMNRNDVQSSSWNARATVGMNPTGANMNPYAQVTVDGHSMGVPSSSGGGNGNVVGPGLYTSTTSSWRKNYVTVHTVYWKSFRKLYEYTFIDEYGEEQKEIVSEDFVVPKSAKTESFEHSMFSGKRSRKTWYDKQGNYNSVTEIWIPECWKGVRINGDIYVEIEPVEHAYRSLLSPYETKLPIYGYVYNNRNSSVVSTIDRLKPWQKLYYVVMSRVLRLIAQDKGVLTFLNSLMIDKEFGIKRTLQMAEDQGLIPYNPLAYGQGAAIMNNMKVADKVDVTNASTIQHYIGLLQFIESNLEESVGMSPQRLAQSDRRQTATDNYRQTAHSMNNTEPLFAAHDFLWQQIMQGYMEMMISSLSDASGKIRGFLNDEEIAIIDLGLISLEDEYLLKIANSSKNAEILGKSQTIIQALIQNEKASLSTLIELMKTDDLYEFQSDLRKIEEDIRLREEKAAQDSERRQESMMLREFLVREDIQKFKLDEVMLAKTKDLEREHVKGRYLITSFNLKEDLDKSGESDIMQDQLKYAKFLADLEKTEKAFELRQMELEQRKIEHGDGLVDKDINRIFTANEKHKDRKARADKKKSED